MAARLPGDRCLASGDILPFHVARQDLRLFGSDGNVLADAIKASDHAAEEEMGDGGDFNERLRLLFEGLVP